MLLMTRNWSWGYGPQPPLYDWLQILTFQVFGRGTGGVVLLLPSILWEFQRATSHSIMLLVAISWTFWAWFWLIAKQDLSHWLLGVILGLGGLSKWNYCAVPTVLAVASHRLWSQRVEMRGVVLALAQAGAIVAAPYYWSARHPADSLASVYKLYGEPSSIWPWMPGLGQLAANLLSGLALPLLIGGPLLAFAARGFMGNAPAATLIMLRAAMLVLGVTVLLVLAFDVTNIQARWLIPIMLVATAAGLGWLATALSPKAFRA